MMHTRSNPNKSAPHTNTPPRLGTSSTTSGSSSDLLADDPELVSLLASLPKDSKTQVKILKVIFAKQLKTEMDILKEEINKKDEIIKKLDNEVKDLRDKVFDLEAHLDRVEQYERRDTIILSGPSLPPETPAEKPASVVTSAIKDHLKINIKEEDISVAHRLGSTQPGRERPVIIKLVNRSLKYDIMGACVQLRPPLYINESLTPKRLTLFKQVLAIRKQHRPKFQQCFTKDGNIIVKLKHSTVKHIITDERSFMALLDKYPYMKDTHNESRPTE